DETRGQVGFDGGGRIGDPPGIVAVPRDLAGLGDRLGRARRRLRPLAIRGRDRPRRPPVEPACPLDGPAVARELIWGRWAPPGDRPRVHATAPCRVARRIRTLLPVGLFPAADLPRSEFAGQLRAGRRARLPDDPVRAETPRRSLLSGLSEPAGADRPRRGRMGAGADP